MPTSSNDPTTAHAPTANDLAEGKALAQISLYQDRSFWGMTITQLLGAFNDNLFKQYVLLAAVAGMAGAEGDDRQSLASAAFAIPFVLFSGFGGYLSDRISKRSIIVSCKVAEICVMLAAVVVMAFGSNLHALVAVLFFMGTQSELFGPAKYGVLPEMFAGDDLPRANGWIQLTTFLAIIFGTATAGRLMEFTNPALFGVVCVLIAILGTATSLLIRRLRAAKPGLPFQPSALFVQRETLRMLFSDRPLLRVLSISSLFWFSGGMIPMAVNSLGVKQMHETKSATSVLMAGLGLGIGAGCLAAGKLSRGKIAFHLVSIGCAGVIICAVAIWAPSLSGQLLTYQSAMAVLILMGFFAGLFAVPLQVFLQARPPDGQKGRMIGAMNLFNWIGILLASGIYGVCVLVADRLNIAPSLAFVVAAACLLPTFVLLPKVAENLG